MSERRPASPVFTPDVLLANQMGAPATVVLPVLGQLLLLGAAYLILALVIGRRT